MKITIVHGSNDTYGASRVLIHEIECLLSLGHSVHLVVPAAGPLNDAIPLLGPGAQISVEPSILVLRRSNLKDALRFPKLPIPLRTADIVVLWTLAVAGYIPLLRTARKRFYVAVHELLGDRKARFFFRGLLKGSFPVTACSYATSKWLQSIGVQGNRITVTYPVVDLLPNADNWEASITRDEERPYTVAVIGRVNGHKGHLEVAKAFQDPSMRGEDWRLVLAGAPFPGQEKALEEVLELVQSDCRLTYLGELSSLRQLRGSVDLVAVFPTKAEPFGLVPIEAWSFGIRSIGYGDGGAAEVLPLVGGTSVERAEPATRRIASALSVEREYRRSRPALPAFAEVGPQLSFEHRVLRLSEVLAKLDRRSPTSKQSHSQRLGPQARGNV